MYHQQKDPGSGRPGPGQAGEGCPWPAPRAPHRALVAFQSSRYGCFYQWRVLFVGVLIPRVLLGPPDFSKLPYELRLSFCIGEQLCLLGLPRLYSVAPLHPCSSSDSEDFLPERLQSSGFKSSLTCPHPDTQFRWFCAEGGKSMPLKHACCELLTLRSPVQALSTSYHVSRT